MDLLVLVVASEDGDSVFVLHLQCQDVADCLDAVKPSVHIVSQEQIIGVLRRSKLTGGFPPISKSYSKSCICPWMSPQTVTGALTSLTLGSFIRIYLAWIN